MNVLFEFSNNPFRNDLSSQYARMALSLSMENNVSIVYRDDAVVLSHKPFHISIKEINYFDFERFLVEQEIDMFVLTNNKFDDDSSLKDCVKKISINDLDKLYFSQDVIFRN